MTNENSWGIVMVALALIALLLCPLAASGLGAGIGQGAAEWERAKGERVIDEALARSVDAGTNALQADTFQAHGWPWVLALLGGICGAVVAWLTVRRRPVELPLVSGSLFGYLTAGERRLLEQRMMALQTQMDENRRRPLAITEEQWGGDNDIDA